ncbi:hypothetical protein GIB67_035563 [Kingdonia uniflora]|uniref:Rx N-terminal domain-containing protein n=1 Tax=Kingdonia uniflora TaxID=39325 RepID=A0A7J7LCZ0_9MAGN|nr:hypothetical protein GIB67_035563 [Kingdonia uniflora]
MADALISVVVEQLAPFLLGKLKEEVKLVLGAPEDVQELHDTFDNIRDVLDDAEKRHVKNVLLNLEKNEIKKAPESAWLEKLKDVSYEMEDVLDEWHTKILKSKIAAIESSAPDDIDGARTGKKKVWSCFLSPCFCFNKATFHHNIGRRILELKGRLDRLITEEEKYKFKVTKKDDEQQVRLEEERRHTISRIKASEDKGRIPLSIWNLKSLRTLLVWSSLHIDCSQPSIDCQDLTSLSHLSSLRTLDLRYTHIKELPKEIEKLIHLRYLDLSWTDVEELPEVVTNLSNLQTLRLNRCDNLRRLPNEIGKLISLRHLEADHSALEKLPESINSLSNLQTLKLNYCSELRRLPDEMGKMVSLRQLEVERTKLEEIPEAVGNLSNLQTLKLNWCSSLRRLLNDMGKMVSLRHLEFLGSRLQYLPRGIGKLRDLETLSEFIVSEEGSDIEELKDLNNLRGKLRISNINGIGKEASHEAILKDKEHLRHLVLRFNDDDDDEAVQSVLELFEPHPNLEKLEIENYNGSKFPSWMEFPNWEGRSIMLRQLTICSCQNLKVLPALGRLEFLECLVLKELDSVSQMGLEVLGVLNGDIVFPKLKELSIRKMKHWKDWVIMTTVNITVMPLLQKLTIWSCPMLKSLPCQILSNSLREMTIDSCPHLEVSCLSPFLEKLELHKDAGSLLISLPMQNGLHSNLKYLVIQRSPHSTLPEGLSQLKALQTLEVRNCDSITCIPDELQHVTSLQKLYIWWCPILGPRCKKDVGEDRNIISHIPNIHIDGKKEVGED